MILLLHILIALASIAVATTGFLSPSKTKLRVTYGLVILTIASGTYLALSSQTHILEACLLGLVYLGGVAACMIAAHKKLAQAHSE